MTLAAATPFSFWVFAALCAMLAASCWVFYVLDRRWTVKRYWTYLHDWAREHGYKVLSIDKVHPPQVLAHAHPRVCAMLTNQSSTIVQIETDGTVRWNLFIRPIRSHWPTTALRPTRA